MQCWNAISFLPPPLSALHLHCMSLQEDCTATAPIFISWLCSSIAMQCTPEEKKTKINGSCHVFLENVHRIGIRDNGAISGLMAVIIITLHCNVYDCSTSNKEILDYVFFSAVIPLKVCHHKSTCALHSTSSHSIPQQPYMMVNVRKKWEWRIRRKYKSHDFFFLGENRILKFFEWMNEAMKIKWSSISFLLLLFSKSKVRPSLTLAGWLTGLLAFFFSGRMSHWGRKEGMLLKSQCIYFSLARDMVKFCAICSLLRTHWLYMEFMVNLVVRVERRDILFYIHTQQRSTHSTHTMHCALCFFLILSCI